VLRLFYPYPVISKRTARILEDEASGCWRRLRHVCMYAQSIMAMGVHRERPAHIADAIPHYGRAHCKQLVFNKSKYGSFLTVITKARSGLEHQHFGGLVDKRAVSAAQSDHTSGSRQRICGEMRQTPERSMLVGMIGCRSFAVLN
jgi:hypothetical protein